MVGVAQLAERRIVAPKVEGSSPFSHPICAVSSAGQSRGLLIPRSRVRIPDGAPCELQNARKAYASGRFLLRVAARRLLGKAPTCMGCRMRRARGFVHAEARRNHADKAVDIVHATRGGTVPIGQRTSCTQREAEPCRWGGGQGVRGLGLAGARVSKSACGLMAAEEGMRSLGALAPLPSRVSSAKMRLPRRGNCFYFTW